MKKRKYEPSFDERNGMNSPALFQIGLEKLPYVMVQISERGWVLLNRDYLVLPEAKWRLEEVPSSATVQVFEQDPRTFVGVWTEMNDRHLFFYDTQFDESADYLERLQRFHAYQLGCVGRS
ncbi:hypothetical protein ACRQ5Q_06600 [Bradyrhizobium sp. PMVTL-01]|uniref:hypothetical protein n=1 Tax=Bradyrhizobium sp. PMVTL-01 TaxID=3434999 RepID=UPI003F720C3D